MVECMRVCVCCTKSTTSLAPAATISVFGLARCFVSKYMRDGSQQSALTPNPINHMHQFSLILSGRLGMMGKTDHSGGPSGQSGLMLLK